VLALTADDIERAEKQGKIASLIGMEGGHSINSSLATLRMMHRLGARYMTLTHSLNVPWADSATDAPKLDGLSAFGEDVVREMNRLGMMVDISHVSPDCMKATLKITKAPVIFSHSSARGVADHPRNVPDDVLRLVAANGGVVMVNFYPAFVSQAYGQRAADRSAEEARLKALYSGQPDRRKAALDAWDAAHPEPPATLAEVADHVDHIRQIAGVDHVGIGSDFDGIDGTHPEGLEGVDKYPALFRELARRGWSDQDLAKLAGGNVLRALRRAEAVSRSLESTAASMATVDSAK